MNYKLLKPIRHRKLSQSVFRNKLKYETPAKHYS